MNLANNCQIGSNKGFKKVDIKHQAGKIAFTEGPEKRFNLLKWPWN